LSRVEHERRILEARIAKARAGAEGEKAKLDEVVLTVEKSAGENGKLFGSVTAMEIEALLRDNGFTIDRRRIQLDENIKSLGEYDLGVKLHRDVVASIKVLVVARPESE
jgi:large subunit ribosomal protein L9